jgi:Rod binding domain-containing protein
MDTQTFTVGPLPPGITAPTTDAERAVYRKALDLEGVFTQHLVDAMLKSTSTDDDQGAGAGIYKQMANEQVNQALIDGGGFGLAGALYTQMKDAA